MDFFKVSQATMRTQVHATLSELTILITLFTKFFPDVRQHMLRSRMVYSLLSCLPFLTPQHIINSAKRNGVSKGQITALTFSSYAICTLFRYEASECIVLALFDAFLC